MIQVTHTLNWKACLALASGQHQHQLRGRAGLRDHQTDGVVQTSYVSDASLRSCSGRIEAYDLGGSENDSAAWQVTEFGRQQKQIK